MEKKAKIKNPLNKLHKKSSRHIICLELKDLSLKDKYKIIHYCHKSRKAYNDLIRFYKIQLENLKNSKEYQQLLELYLSLPEDKRKFIAEKLNKLREAFSLSKELCAKQMIPIAKKHNLNAVLGLTLSEKVWGAIEKCIFSKGKNIHFKNKNYLPSLQAKQFNREIVFKIDKENNLYFKWNDLNLYPLIKDNFQQREINNIIYYLQNSKLIDNIALVEYQNNNKIIDTFRPCYATIIVKIIRNKLRIFINLTIEGKVLSKLDKNGNEKHFLGFGNIGCDIGTQTIAYSTNEEVGLENLAEYGKSIDCRLSKIAKIQQKMDISRRVTNPQYFNPNGTIKELKENEKRIWIKSKKYKKLEYLLKNFYRKDSINKKLAINKKLNYLRSLGDTFITESKNANRLKAKAKTETTFNEKTGKYNKKRRFGRSIQNRNPGYFQQQAKLKFPNYIEVPNDYRASQYDISIDEYIKKELSYRYFPLQNGIMVQRDMYSAFLLQNFKKEFEIKFVKKEEKIIEKIVIDKEKCKLNFNNFYQLQNKRINEIKQNKLKILNSGILI